MMTSKLFIWAAIGMVCLHASAEGIPSAEARSYYQIKLENEPEGVYEWDDRGLVFVQVRIPTARMRSVEKIESAELGATRRVLRKWIEHRATARRVDPIYPLGMELVRNICRRFRPSLEYGAEWRFSGASCSFSRDVDDERITATVFFKDDLINSIPEAYIKPVSEGVWMENLPSVITTCIDNGKIRELAFEAGALDFLCNVQDGQSGFPEFTDPMFNAQMERWLKSAAEPLRGTQSIGAAEYDSVNKKVCEYLLSSDRAKKCRTDALALLEPKPMESMWFEPVDVVVTTNRSVKTWTNGLVKCTCCTNSETIAKHSAAVSSLGNSMRREIVSVEKATVGEEIVETIVRTTKRKMGSRILKEYGCPRFEELMLGGGYLPNSSVARTKLGDAAVKKFYQKATMKDRESVLLSAIRENPGDKELWNLLGRVFQTQNDNLGALVCFRNALRLDSKYDFALTNLANVYAQMGCRNLACGLALIVRGVSQDAWCIKQAEAVLRKEW